MIDGQGPSIGKERPMVHVPTRGDVPVRLGPGVPITPGYGPSTMSRQPYTDPMQFELEREKVLDTTLAPRRPLVRRSPSRATG